MSSPGLTTSEVQDRVTRGLANDVPSAPTRTVGQILRANVVTRFNLLLGSLLAVILWVGPIQDALFGLVIVSNTAVGIVQELRAKHTIERLALISAPVAHVIRDGAVRPVPMRGVVVDDIIEASPGEQIVVDGVVVQTDQCEIDESLLTGESEPVGKPLAAEVLSGSFVVAGRVRYRAVRVGRHAYATRLAEEARRFTLATSELRAGIDRIIALVTWLLVPAAALLLASQLQAQGLRGALSGAVAGTVAMVPEGLVLLLTVAFAVSVVRLGRRKVLVQELPAVETLARVDVLCFDKTGTITTGDLTVGELVRLDRAGERGTDDVEAALGAVAGADPAPNATLRAIGWAWAPPDGWTASDRVPFSSARKWSAVTFDGRGTWLLGAPEVLLGAAMHHPDAADSRGEAPKHQTAESGGHDEVDILRRAEAYATAGRRVVLLAAAAGTFAPDDGAPPLTPAALVVLDERVRGDAADTIAYFNEQQVQTKVVSGDHPRTVGTVAARVGIRGAGTSVDARDLPTNPQDLADVVERNAVFGRVVPHQKREMVDALKERGHVVAMTGDGVNDVLALKNADLGVAMGGGSDAARAVAKLVLLDGRFATMPHVVAEGRRVIANIERVATLFLTKTVYALLLALAVGVAGLPFPFLPRHLTLIGSLTIGIPAFFLALEPNARRARPGFVPRVLRVATPAGIVAAAGTLAAYSLAREALDVAQDEARTAATLTLAGIGLVLLALVARPPNRLRVAGLIVLVGAFVGVLAIPWLRKFFAVAVPSAPMLAVIGGVVLLAGPAIVVLCRGAIPSADGG